MGLNANAGTVDTNINYSGTLTGACVLPSSVTVSFGNFRRNDESTMKQAFTIPVQCTEGTPYTLMGNKYNHTIVGGSINIGVQFYKDAAYTQNVRDNFITGTATGGVDNLQVYGRINGSNVDTANTWTAPTSSTGVGYTFSKNDSSARFFTLSF
jgi:spore coat protein U-like protein